MLNVYKPLTTGQIASSFRPKHRFIVLWVLSWYDGIAAVILFLIILFTIEPLLSRSPLFYLWLVAYIMIFAVKNLTTHCNVFYDLGLQGLRRLQMWFPKRAELARQRMATYRRQKVYKGCRPYGYCLVAAVALTCMAALLIVAVRSASHSSHFAIQPDTAMWLLFSPPIWLVARTDNLRYIAGIGCLTAAAITITNLSGNQPFAPETLRIDDIQSLWLVLVSILPVILLSYLAEREAGTNIAIYVAEKITRIHSTSMQVFANRAAAVIKRKLDFVDVNIFLVTQNGSPQMSNGLLMIGAATQAGQDLVKQGYFLPPQSDERDIITYAAIHKKYCIVNDISRDSRGQYQHREGFRYPQAELAVPILLCST